MSDTAVSSRKAVGGLTLVLLLMGSLALVLLAGPQDASGASARALGTPPDVEQAVLSTSVLTHPVFLPLIARESGPRSFRVGFCSTSLDILRYPAIRGLAAGWYVNFSVDPDPPRPGGIKHVQTVRLHQVTECWPERIRDRQACPYVEPHTYTLTSPPTREELRASVAANPGALWLIGNEMDRYDWGVRDRHTPGQYLVAPGGQDEMLHQLYAHAYHELYHLIKEVDETALVAIGGVIQATPARLWYLTTVWDTYRAHYGHDMPVDVWNVHNFILQETCTGHGADIPPGCPPSVCRPKENGDPCYGTLYGDHRHNSLEIFDQQIRAFRRWMRDRGQQNKPLIVSEYGILYHHLGMEDPHLVRTFMEDTFDYFMHTRDCNLGYPADDCRLVQRWAWWSLDDRDFNQYGRLFDPHSRAMTPLGQAFAAYTWQHLDPRGSGVPDYWPSRR